MKQRQAQLKRTIYFFYFLMLLVVIQSCKSGERNSPDSEGNNDTTTISDPLYKKYHLDKIKLPAGFKIEVYGEVPAARSLCVSPNGTVFVGTKNSKVFAITTNKTNGKAGKIYEIASGLTAPTGVAFKNGSLFIGARSTIFRLDQIESHLDNPPKPVIVYDQYPSDAHHGLRFIAFGPDGKLYVPVGAPCNICEPSKPVYASITRINDDGTGYEVFAHGIRNTVGFDWDPVTKQIWFTDNGRDNLGDDIPGDELNMAPKEGMNFGYPYCHQGNLPDPEFGKGKNCNDYTPPAKVLHAHVAALGIRFNTGSIFPAEYKNAIFIAEHGSWNRTIPIGYRLEVVTKDGNGNLQDPKVFAEGWLQNEKEVIGRPVDIQFLQDGSMLVSDDYNGVVYRISYTPIS